MLNLVFSQADVMRKFRKIDIMKPIQYLWTVLVLFLVSCDNKPTETEIRDAISKIVSFPFEKIESLHLYYATKFDTGLVRRFHKNLLDNGLIFNPVTTSSDNEYFKDEAHITLTPNGSKYIGKQYNYNDDSSTVFVVIGVEEFSKIDSVIIQKDNNGVDVYATTRLSNLTPFGKIFPEYKENMEIPYSFEMENKNGIWEIVYHH